MEVGDIKTTLFCKVICISRSLYVIRSGFSLQDVFCTIGHLCVLAHLALCPFLAEVERFPKPSSSFERPYMDNDCSFAVSGPSAWNTKQWTVANSEDTFLLARCQALKTGKNQRALVYLRRTPGGTIVWPNLIAADWNTCAICGWTFGSYPANS